MAPEEEPIMVGEAMTADIQRRQPRDHMFNYKQEEERSNWK